MERKFSIGDLLMIIQNKAVCKVVDIKTIYMNNFRFYIYVVDAENGKQYTLCDYQLKRC